MGEVTNRSGWVRSGVVELLRCGLGVVERVPDWWLVPDNHVKATERLSRNSRVHEHLGHLEVDLRRAGILHAETLAFRHLGLVGEIVLHVQAREHIRSDGVHTQDDPARGGRLPVVQPAH